MIDSNDTIQYENGRDSGYDDGFGDAKSVYLDIIEDMAYEIAMNRYPKKYTHTDDSLRDYPKETMHDDTDYWAEWAHEAWISKLYPFL